MWRRIFPRSVASLWARSNDLYKDRWLEVMNFDSLIYWFSCCSIFMPETLIIFVCGTYALKLIYCITIVSFVSCWGQMFYVIPPLDCTFFLTVYSNSSTSFSTNISCTHLVCHFFLNNFYKKYLRRQQNCGHWNRHAKLEMALEI